MGGVCCTTRDRNDKIEGIEKRNNANFYFNYPLMLEFMNTRLREIELVQGPLSSVDVNYLKWAFTQLQLEIEYNQRNLINERK